MTDLEVRNFQLAGWIADRNTKGTGSSRASLFLSIKKPPDRRQTVEHLRYPNESAEYRAARNALLNDEIALRAQIETVAAKRRALPPGGVNYRVRAARTCSMGSTARQGTWAGERHFTL